MAGRNDFSGAVPLDARTKANEKFDPKQGVIELSKLTMATWSELKELKEIVGGAAADLHRIANVMTGTGGSELPHAPMIAPKFDGRWGVSCLACSYAAEDYVWPCLVIADSPEGPPAELVAAPELVELPKED